MASNKRRRPSDVTRINRKETNATTHKKQTSLLSFWGVRTKANSKTKAENKFDQNAKQCTSPLPKAKNNKPSIDETTIIDNKRQITLIESENVETKKCKNAGVGRSSEEKLTKQQTSVAITPCKVPVKRKSNGDDIDEHRGKDLEEPKSINEEEPNNSSSSSLPAPVDKDDNGNSDNENHDKNNDCAPKSPQPGLSEYEKLRLRNIERNNARLAALGLLTTTSNVPKSNNRPRPARKRPKVAARAPQQPLRRSSRNRNPKAETKNNWEESMETSKPIQEPAVEVEEEYTVSPLLQYDMSRTGKPENTSADSNSSTNNKGIENTMQSTSNMSLRVTGPRFVPPKGLNAIYSLEFWRNNDLESSLTSHWMVGAGKAGMIALWDTHKTAEDNFVDPILSWKAHSGRWIADAKFLPTFVQTPSRLLTAGNDGTVCLWDLSCVSATTGCPKLLHRTDKSYHSSGIFCMDISANNSSSSSSSMICTGSKDKSVAVSSVDSLEPLWRSDFHTAKVGAVQLKSRGSTLLASASDDGLVGLHDYRASEIVAQLEDAHVRPHSVVWDSFSDNVFATAGLDPIVKIWDQRNLSKPFLCLQGHVPTSTTKCKRIHRPVFFDPRFAQSNGASAFLLTGGQRSASVSVYKLEIANAKSHSSFSLCSRGKLPADCGDSGCIAINGKQVAVTVDQGEILLLEPTSTQ